MERKGRIVPQRCGFLLVVFYVSFSVDEGRQERRGGRMRVLAEGSRRER